MKKQENVGSAEIVLKILYYPWVEHLLGQGFVH